MTCALCSQPIATGDVNMHHPIYRSNGGTEIEPTHQRCHIELHRKRGDFKEWGKQGGQKAALTLRWSWNLLNVRNHSRYADHRQTYLMNYGQAGWSEGLIM